MTPPAPPPIVTEADRREAARHHGYYGPEHDAWIATGKSDQEASCCSGLAALIARIRTEAYRAGAEAALAAVQAENVEMFKLNSWARADAATVLSIAREKLVGR